MEIRKERQQDASAIRYVNEQAFGDAGEAGLVEKLRARKRLVCSLVAIEDGQVVGHILFTTVTVEQDGANFHAVALGPMAVVPEFQRKGIGSRLVRAGLDECLRLGHEIVFVLGHADYYARFGFAPAKPRGIACEFEAPESAWMVLELREGALGGRKGTVRYEPEFREVT